MMLLYFLSEISKYCQICKKNIEILVQTLSNRWLTFLHTYSRNSVTENMLLLNGRTCALYCTLSGLPQRILNPSEASIKKGQGRAGVEKLQTVISKCKHLNSTSYRPINPLPINCMRAQSDNFKSIWAADLLHLILGGK